MRGFFTLPDHHWEFPVRFVHVIGAFAIYLSIGLGGGFLFGAFPPSTGAICWLNFLVTLFSLCALVLYCRVISPSVCQGILRNPATPPHFAQDLGYGLYSLVFAFPLFLITSALLDWFIRAALHIQELPDQIAVRFLKMTFATPLYFSLTALSLILFVPCIEELLFRGFLQSWLRKRLGPRVAIVLTAFCFSFFHYAGDQGAANLLVIGSLLPLALFLGFIYEKQNSLLASITLHASFNGISIFNLYFFG